MSGDIITNDIETRIFTIQLSTNCEIFGNKIFINKADVVDLWPAKEKMILGLDFIIHNNRSITITKDYLLISTNSQMSPIIDEITSELRTKRGDAPTNPTKNKQCPCDTPGSCKIKESKNHGNINTIKTWVTSVVLLTTNSCLKFLKDWWIKKSYNFKFGYNSTLQNLLESLELSYIL